jgi:hypothetical protein
MPLHRVVGLHRLRVVLRLLRLVDRRELLVLVRRDRVLLVLLLLDRRKLNHHRQNTVRYVF